MSGKMKFKSFYRRSYTREEIHFSCCYLRWFLFHPGTLEEALEEIETSTSFFDMQNIIEATIGKILKI